MDQQPSCPEVTRRLREKGPETLGHETTLARAPLWAARASAKPVQLALLSGPLVMHGNDFRQVEGAQLTVGDQRVVAELTTRYVLAGCPSERAVPITLTETARALGFEGGANSGVGRRAAKASLARVRSVTFSSALSADDRFPRIWGLIDNADPISPRGGRPAAVREAGYVTLNKTLAQLLRGGHITFLHYPTWDAIARDDAIAARLWCYLEAERITTGWNYSLFAARAGGVDDERYMPAIADMLLLDWPVRRQIAARIRRACEVIARLDGRYQIDVLRSKTAGMWYLHVHRVRHSPRHTPGPLPLPVHQGWRRAYGARRPSPRQVAVLSELVLRRGAEWVAEQFAAGAGEGDPFGFILARDRQLSGAAIAAERRREQSWQNTKAAEAVSAPVSLANILSGLVQHGLIPAPPRPETGTSSDGG